MSEKDDQPEMISQPLITSEGFINPACMNELKDKIRNMPKTHQRLSGDDEWNASKHQWTFKKDIVGAFAMWACRQSPYSVPDDLETVCKYLSACLERDIDWGNNGMKELSLCEINKILHDILYEKGVVQFDNWNRCKNGSTPEIVFTSRFDGNPDPDNDFIDLDALLHNVCLSIRDERRRNKAFNDDFEKRHGPNQPPTP